MLYLWTVRRFLGAKLNIKIETAKKQPQLLTIIKNGYLQHFSYWAA